MSFVRGSTLHAARLWVAGRVKEGGLDSPEVVHDSSEGSILIPTIDRRCVAYASVVLGLVAHLCEDLTPVRRLWGPYVVPV